MQKKSPIQKHEDSLHAAIRDIALNPVARPPVSSVVVTPKGQKLVNHYRGGYHFFTIA